MHTETGSRSGKAVYQADGDDARRCVANKVAAAMDGDLRSVRTGLPEPRS